MSDRSGRPVGAGGRGTTVLAAQLLHTAANGLVVVDGRVVGLSDATYRVLEVHGLVETWVRLRRIEVLLEESSGVRGRGERAGTDLGVAAARSSLRRLADEVLAGAVR